MLNVCHVYVVLYVSHVTVALACSVLDRRRSDHGQHDLQRSWWHTDNESAHKGEKVTVSVVTVSQCLHVTPVQVDSQLSLLTPHTAAALAMSSVQPGFVSSHSLWDISLIQISKYTKPCSCLCYWANGSLYKNSHQLFIHLQTGAAYLQCSSSTDTHTHSCVDRWRKGPEDPNMAWSLSTNQSKSSHWSNQAQVLFFYGLFCIFESCYIVHDTFNQCLSQSVLSDPPVQYSSFCCMLIPSDFVCITALVSWLVHPPGKSVAPVQYLITTGMVCLVLTPGSYLWGSWRITLRTTEDNKHPGTDHQGKHRKSAGHNCSDKTD